MSGSGSCGSADGAGHSGQGESDQRKATHMTRNIDEFTEAVSSWL